MSTAKRGGIGLPDRSGSSKKEGGVLSRLTSSISESPIIYRGKTVAEDTAFVAKKLLKSTGKAAWILGTTLLVLAVPLIIEWDRDQQLTEMEMQQASLLGTPTMSVGPPNRPSTSGI